MYCIYRITNCINGKTYIGQHKYKKTAYDKYMGSGKLLQLAYKKYGIENFIKGIIIDGVEDKETINKLEIKYIAYERLSNGNGCYNIADGGEGINYWEGKKRGPHSEEWKRNISDANKGKHHVFSEEARKHMSEAKKGKHLSAEHRRKLSEALKGHEGYWKGKKDREGYWKGRAFSAEHRRKLSEASKGRCPSEESRNKMSAAHKGKKMSADARKKISEVTKGRAPWSKGKHYKLVDGKRVWY